MEYMLTSPNDSFKILEAECFPYPHPLSFALWDPCPAARYNPQYKDVRQIPFNIFIGVSWSQMLPTLFTLVGGTSQPMNKAVWSRGLFIAYLHLLLKYTELLFFLKKNRSWWIPVPSQSLSTSQTIYPIKLFSLSVSCCVSVSWQDKASTVKV